MSVLNGRDYIYLVWKDTQTRRQFIVGELSKNGKFEFKYVDEVQEAIKNGFKPLISFEDLDKIYYSDILFPVFSSRLPDRKRRDIQKILEKYELSSFDDYKLLKRSGAKLPIDNLKFIDPILGDNEDIPIKRLFYLAGPRHYLGCEGNDCKKSENVDINESLILIPEPENDFDSNAIKVVNNKNVHIGYIPRYYTQEMLKFIEKGYKCKCSVFEVNKETDCDECIKIELTIEEQ